MACEHAETTTLLWLYGEADEAHAAHVASCPDCQAVADLHVGVVAAVGPVLHASEPAAHVVPAPANRPLWSVLGGVSVLAVAAAAALAVLISGPAVGPRDSGDALAATEPVSLPAFDVGSELDDELSELDADMDLLAQDLMTL